MPWGPPFPETLTKNMRVRTHLRIRSGESSIDGMSEYRKTVRAAPFVRQGCAVRVSQFEPEKEC